MAKTEKETNTAEERETNTAEERETKCVEGEKMVKIKLPRARKDEPDEFVSVNERTWLIKRGVEVEVPECVAEVLRHKEEMEEEAYQFDQSAQN